MKTVISYIIRHINFAGINRQAVAACLCVAAVGTISACSSHAASSTPPTAAQAISQAAAQLGRTRTLTVSLAIGSPGAESTSITGTVREQITPTTLLDAVTTTKLGVYSTPSLVFLTGTAAYLRSSTLDMWGKVSLPALLKAGLAGDIYPEFVADPVYQVRMLAAATDVREDGRQQVAGVETTHYTGSCRPAAALARLSGTAATVLGLALRKLTRDVRFDVWIDARHQVRKLRVVETAKNVTVTTTLVITSINQTTVVVPAPGDQFAVPASSLRNAG